MSGGYGVINTDDATGSIMLNRLTRHGKIEWELLWQTVEECLYWCELILPLDFTNTQH